MKKGFVGILLLALCCALAGCGKGKPQTPSAAATKPVQAAEWPVDLEAASLAAGLPAAEDAFSPVALNAGGQDIVEIPEKMFIAQTNDIYLNADEYLGKTIRYEGMFLRDVYGTPETRVCYVIRYGPGCCGYDANAGFEVVWDESVYDAAGPADNAWVEVTGVLEEYNEAGYNFLRLRLISMVEKSERGAEFVFQ